MRLLNVDTLQLEDLAHSSLSWPSYTILSHTWGEGEVTFQDLKSGRGPSLAGYEKLKGCCDLSKKERFQHTWIDTCCIDKSSSAELSEAINSMFSFYSNAEVCYAYLSDVTGVVSDEASRSSFTKSRWFTRG